MILYNRAQGDPLCRVVWVSGCVLWARCYLKLLSKGPLLVLALLLLSPALLPSLLLQYPLLHPEPRNNDCVPGTSVAVTVVSRTGGQAASAAGSQGGAAAVHERACQGQLMNGSRLCLPGLPAPISSYYHQQLLLLVAVAVVSMLVRHVVGVGCVHARLYSLVLGHV
jgi:hypothetical protein